VVAISTAADPAARCLPVPAEVCNQFVEVGSVELGNAVENDTVDLRRGGE